MPPVIRPCRFAFFLVNLQSEICNLQWPVYRPWRYRHVGFLPQVLRWATLKLIETSRNFTKLSAFLSLL
jgi:hypothetical protein